MEELHRAEMEWGYRDCVSSAAPPPSRNFHVFIRITAVSTMSFGGGVGGEVVLWQGELGHLVSMAINSVFSSHPSLATAGGTGNLNPLIMSILP